MTDIERSVAQYKALDDETPEPDAWAQARNMLGEQFRAHGEVMDTDPVASDPVPVAVNPDMTGWTTVGPDDPGLTGYVITWTATGHALQPEAVLTGGTTGPDGYTIAIPDDRRLLPIHGGPVRVRHELGGPVTVHAYGRDGEPVGYLFAQELTDDEVAVELSPHTYRLHVTRDEEPEG